MAPPVPDAGKRRRLSQAERRAERERQMSFQSLESFPQYSGEREDD